MSTKVLKFAVFALGALAFVALMAAFVIENANPNIRDDRTLFALHGPVDKIAVEGNRLRLTFWWTRVNLLVYSRDAEFLAALERMAATGDSVDLKATLNGAHYDASSGLPVFWLSSLNHGGKEFGPFEARPHWSWRVLRDEQIAVLRGIAHHGNESTNLALSEYNKALSTQVLRREQRGVAYWARGTVYQSRSRAEGTAGGRDYYLVRASEDFAEARRFLNQDHHILVAQSEALLSLGAYPEAQALFDEIMKRWPEHRFSAALPNAFLLRKQGDYQRALRVLDSVPEKSASRDHMPYHYHRGWTLLLLERFSEASSEFTAGIEFQKDWLWAHAGKSCAEQGTGRPDVALAELRKAIEILEQRRPGNEFDDILMGELLNNVRALERKGARGPASARLTVCERFGPNFEEPLRERSKVLDNISSAQVSTG
jgi:tetratricopeptide (TPR) repeat protein